MKTKFYFFLWVCFSTLLISCSDDDPDAFAVTGIALNENMISLKEGRNVTLLATIIPENATNKNLTWLSSDPMVATVSAEGKVRALRAGVATITVVTEDGSKKSACTVTVEPGDPLTGSRTVLVYIAGDNSLSSFALQDFAEMKIGMAAVENEDVHHLVYIDTGSSPRLIELRNEGGEIVETVVKTYGERNSVGVSETQEVFADVFSNSKYQADSYGLVYWSHGDGWLPYPLRANSRWVGADGDNRMNISDFVEILKTAPHFDFILFDACFMQSVEVAYELRDYTDYCIGSPTEIPGPGASYDFVVPAMYYSEDAAKDIAEAYYEPYAAKYAAGKDMTNDNWTGGVSVCALRTEPLAELAMLTKRMIPENIDYSKLRNSVSNYDRRGKRSDHIGYYDLAGMMRIMTDDSAYAAWKQVFDSAVAYWATTPMNYSAFVFGMFSMENTNGVSCYIPSASNTLTDQAYRSTQWCGATDF